MAVIVHVTLPGVTPAQYDAVRAECGWLDRAPDGGLGHFTWFEDGNCRNVDAWESEAAFGAFGEDRLGPALAAVGLDVEPVVEFKPAHEVFTPFQGQVLAS